MDDNLIDDVLQALSKDTRLCSAACSNITLCLKENKYETKKFFEVLYLRASSLETTTQLSREHRSKSSHILLLLGFLYYGGIGVKKSDKLAFEKLKIAAENEDVFAQHCLADCYTYGIGVDEDLKKVIYWTTKSAEGGNSDAQEKLGYRYRYGINVDKDLVKEVYWYTKSGEGGNFTSQCHLGVLYHKRKDFARAVYWYTKSAEGGDVLSRYNLGMCYEKGIGTSKDLFKAIRWYASLRLRALENLFRNNHLNKFLDD